MPAPVLAPPPAAHKLPGGALPNTPSISLEYYGSEAPVTHAPPLSLTQGGEAPAPYSVAVGATGPPPPPLPGASITLHQAPLASSLSFDMPPSANASSSRGGAAALPLLAGGPSSSTTSPQSHLSPPAGLPTGLGGPSDARPGEAGGGTLSTAALMDTRVPEGPRVGGFNFAPPSSRTSIADATDPPASGRAVVSAPPPAPPGPAPPLGLVMVSSFRPEVEKAKEEEEEVPEEPAVQPRQYVTQPSARDIQDAMQAKLRLLKEQQQQRIAMQQAQEEER